MLVTGGAGFIGSHLVAALVERGASVRVLDDLSSGREANLEAVRDAVDLQVADLRDPVACGKAVAACELVFHQAALGSVPRSIEDPATSIDVNVTGTARLLAAARDAGVRRVIYASSSSVYGDSEALPKREGSEGRPLSPYALSKAVGEQLAATFARCYGLECIGLRYFNVYGPRQRPDGPYAAVIPRFFDAALAGTPPTIHGDGEQSRDFTAVDDAVEANLLAARVPLDAPAVAVNVAGGQRATVNELARRILDLCGASVEPQHGPPRPGDVRHSAADLHRAEAILGYRPRVELAAGLARCLQHYRRLRSATTAGDRS